MIMTTTMQTKVTEQIEKIAAEAGLQLITAGTGKGLSENGRGTADKGTWLLMDDSDGLDTRLHVAWEFRSDSASFRLSGQAVWTPDPEFFTEHGLIRHAEPGSGRVRRYRVDFPDIPFAEGDRWGRLTDAIKLLLAPYRVTPAAQDETVGWPELVEIIMDMAEGKRIGRNVRDGRLTIDIDDLRRILADQLAGTSR
jgi:hypothetical protein